MWLKLFWSQYSVIWNEVGWLGAILELSVSKFDEWGFKNTKIKTRQNTKEQNTNCQNTKVTKYKCNKLQMGQNTNRTKYKNSKIQTQQNTKGQNTNC